VTGPSYSGPFLLIKGEQTTTEIAPATSPSVEQVLSPAYALMEALAERRPPSGPEAIELDTPVMVLVEQHLQATTEDGRSPITLSTYTFAVGKLTRFMGGVRVGEASTARLDSALRSMRTAHGATMAKQAKTVLRGALQLAVMANVLGANPVREISNRYVPRFAPRVLWR
jgi:hypothetical protein